MSFCITSCLATLIKTSLKHAYKSHQKGSLWGCQALRLQARTLYNISTLTQLPLRHLELDITESIIVADLTELWKLAHLETLVVKSYKDQDRHDPYARRGGFLPKLDLRACTKLRAVSFKIFVPSGLEVLQGCSVNLVGACNMLTALRSTCTSCSCLVHDAGEVSALLDATFPVLTCLKIDASITPDGCQTDEAGLYPPLVMRLGENVKHLKSLSIQDHQFSKGINLDIMESVQLVSLRVQTVGELNMNISNVASLAASLQEFCIQCDKHVSKHPQMQMLLSAVVDEGNYVHARPFEGRVIRSHELIWTCSAVPVDVEAIHKHFEACSCSACWVCLKRAGVFDRL